MRKDYDDGEYKEEDDDVKRERDDESDHSPSIIILTNLIGGLDKI